MVSPSIDELNRAIRRVRRRRSMILTVRQVGRGLAGIALLFIACVTLEMLLGGSAPVHMICFGGFAAGTLAIGWHTVRSVRRSGVDDRRLAQYVDEHLPDLQQRLVTSVEVREKDHSRFSAGLIEALWQDTAARVHELKIEQVTTSRPAWYAVGAAAVLVGAVFFAGLFSDPFSGAAKRVIWPWAVLGADWDPAAAIQVSPGDVLIRRGSDVTVSAAVKRSAKDVFLMISQTPEDWQRIRMQDGNSAAEFMHHIPGVTADTSYYVQTTAGRSDQYQIRVFDLTRIERIGVEYVYPAYTGIKNTSEKNAGDVIAPKGTQVNLQIVFSQPVQSAMLAFGDGSEETDLALSDTMARGSFEVTADGTYRIDAVDLAGRKIENPIEYAIRAIPDLPPEVTLKRPGGDLKVMALEEVAIDAVARDDYGLTQFALNFSVAGGDEQTVAFMADPHDNAPATLGAKTTIYLEDMRVAPGDFVSYYLTASDNNGLDGSAKIISDIYFLEVIRTDEEFRRAPGAGGGGGQGGQGQPSSALVQTQKNIIAATWKLLNRKSHLTEEQFSEEVGVVAESQQNIAQRAQMSLSRLSERFSFADESFDQAVVHLFEAVMHMQKAAENLASEKLQEALVPEQAALQALLRAEAESRRTAIQMARNQGGGGGGDNQNRERQDLRELFEMEMGRLENRYEMPAAPGARADSGQSDILRKLERLAQRQEQLNRAQADAARRKDLMSEEQRRRQLERLRREQESLRAEADALSRQLARTNPGNRSRESLEQAIEQMRQAGRSLDRQEPGGAAASGQNALQNLRDQQRQIQGRQNTASASDLIKSLDQKADRMQEQEKAIVEQLEGLRNKRALSKEREDKVAGIIADKERLQRELQEAQEAVWALGSKGRQSDPELARRAMEALQALKSEDLRRRIEESKAGLADQRPNLALQTEKQIEQSVNRIAGILRDFSPSEMRSGPEATELAAREAATLLRELENLQQQTDALRSQQGQTALSRRQSESSASGPRSGQHQDLGRLREGLARSRNAARVLSQRRAQGLGWSAEARSVYQELSRRQIEDFMQQPELWRSVLEQARELALALVAQAETGRATDSPLSTVQQQPPERYKSMVEAYYRSLSDTTEMRN